MVSVVQTGETDLIAGQVEKKTIVHNYQNNKKKSSKSVVWEVF